MGQLRQTEKLIADSEAQKKALMQQLLAEKKRLPGFGGEWEMQNLDDLFDLRTGKSKSSSILKTANIKSSTWALSIDKADFAPKIAERVDPLSKGDLIMQKMTLEEVNNWTRCSSSKR